MIAPEVLAFIPARGGSKGLPNKNINLIAGKPLVVWSIEQALKASKVDRVIVSTDSEQIAQIARDAGAEVPFLRPAEISGDSASTESAMLHCLDWLDQQNSLPTTMVLLQATSPVRSSRDIDAAIDLFFTGGHDSLLSVSEFWHFLWRNSAAPFAEYDYKNRPRRQDITEEQFRYKENGSIYVSDVAQLRCDNNRLCGHNLGLYKMPDFKSYEIDSADDWLIVEAILKAKGAEL